MEDIYKAIKNINYADVTDCDTYEIHGLSYKELFHVGQLLLCSKAQNQPEERIVFVKKKKTITNVSEYVSGRNESDIVIGFYSQEDVELILEDECKEVYNFRQILKAKEFSYPTCNIWSDLFCPFNRLMIRTTSENPADVYIIYAYIWSEVRNFFKYFSFISEVSNKKTLMYSGGLVGIYDENVFKSMHRSNSENSRYIPKKISSFSKEQREQREIKTYQKKIREEFTQEYGLQWELMAAVWSPKNIDKFVYLDPDTYSNFI